MRSMFNMGFRAGVESWSLGQSDPKLIEAMNSAKSQLAKVRSWQAAMSLTDSGNLTASDDARFRELDRIVTMDTAAVEYILDKVTRGELIEVEQAADVREWAAQIGEMYKIVLSVTGQQPNKLDITQVQSPTGTWYSTPLIQAPNVKAPAPTASSTSTLPSKASPFTTKNILVGGAVAAGVGIVLYGIFG